ncbi:serine/threonine protein kinase [Colletotrichum graminicola]|nr:serine/threonine protein kinase [Colletotrichum graminicola]
MYHSFGPCSHHQSPVSLIPKPSMPSTSLCYQQGPPHRPLERWSTKEIPFR